MLVTLLSRECLYSGNWRSILSVRYYVLLVILNLDFNFLNIISSFSHRVYGSEFKMDVYLRIAQLYLEEQDHVSAEAYINRAAMLHAEVANKHLQITYKVITTCTCIILYSRLFSTVKYFVRKILGCIKFSMRLDRSKIKSYLKFVTPLFCSSKIDYREIA